MKLPDELKKVPQYSEEEISNMTDEQIQLEYAKNQLLDILELDDGAS